MNVSGLAAVELDDGLVTLVHRTGEVAALKLPEDSELIVGGQRIAVEHLLAIELGRD